MELKRNKKGKENKAAWKFIEAIARVARRWPAWLRGEVKR